MKDNLIDFAAIRDNLKPRNHPGGMCLEHVSFNREGCNPTNTVFETCSAERHELPDSHVLADAQGLLILSDEDVFRALA
jgi:hypothetical protein